MICTLLRFLFLLCISSFSLSRSLSISACAQAAVSFSFGRPKAPFFCVQNRQLNGEQYHPECTKAHHFYIRNPKIFWGGGTAPSQTLPLVRRGDTPSPHPILPRRLDSRAFGARSPWPRRLDPPACAVTNITYFMPCFNLLRCILYFDVLLHFHITYCVHNTVSGHSVLLLLKD